MEDGGLFSAQVAIPFSGTNDARAAVPTLAPGADLLGLPAGATLLPGAYMGLAAPPEKPASAFNRFYAYGLAFLALSVVPLAAGFFRRRLI
jgi:hypothetical protein